MLKLSVLSMLVVSAAVHARNGAPSVSDQTTRVSLLAKDEAPWNVTVGQQTCVTPCTLELAAGAYQLEAENEERRVSKPVVIPTGQSQVTIIQPGSFAVQMAGLVTMGVGVIGMVLALVLPATALSDMGYDKYDGFYIIYNTYALAYIGIPSLTVSLTGLIMFLGSKLDTGKVRVRRSSVW